MIGRPARAAPASASIPSGTLPTTRPTGTTHTCRSGTSVSARRPSPTPPARQIVPVSAIATEHVVSDAVEPLETVASARREARVLDELDPGRSQRRRKVGRNRRCGVHRAGSSASAIVRRLVAGGGTAGRRRRSRRARSTKRSIDLVGREPERSRVGALDRARPPVARHPARPRAPGARAPSTSSRALSVSPPRPERAQRQAWQVAASRSTRASGPGSRPSRPDPLQQPPDGQAERLGRGEPSRALEDPADEPHRRRLAALAVDRLASTAFARRCSSTSGMSMRTGHASKHAPHSVDANGQRRTLLDALELRREDRADRAGVDRAVGVTSGAAVHGTDVEAGAAADAGERLPADGIGEHARAAVVEQHEVEHLGSVAGTHARPQRCVRVHALTRRRARQELQEHLEVLEPRQHLLDAHDGDQDAGEGRAHATVALGLDDRDRARSRRPRSSRRTRPPRPAGTARAGAARAASASAVGSSLSSGRSNATRKRSRISVRFLWIAGTTMCDGDVAGELHDQLGEVGLESPARPRAPAPR